MCDSQISGQAQHASNLLHCFFSIVFLHPSAAWLSVSSQSLKRKRFFEPNRSGNEAIGRTFADLDARENPDKSDGLHELSPTPDVAGNGPVEVVIAERYNNERQRLQCHVVPSFHRG